MPVIDESGDLKRLQERRAWRSFFDYAESGNWIAQTFRENFLDFQPTARRDQAPGKLPLALCK